MSFDQNFDLTAGVYFYFYNIIRLVRVGFQNISANNNALSPFQGGNVQKKSLVACLRSSCSIDLASKSSSATTADSRIEGVSMLPHRRRLNVCHARITFSFSNNVCGAFYLQVVGLAVRKETA